MAAIVDVENPAELRKDGMNARSAVRGCIGGTDDWTKERRDLPELGFERLTAELKRFDVEAFLGQFGKAGADIIAAKNARRSAC